MKSSPDPWLSVSWERVGSRFVLRASVTVLSEECDEGGGGRALGELGEVGEATASDSSSSGLAMRRPPNDCDRLKSPFMMFETAAGDVAAARGV